MLSVDFKMFIDRPKVMRAVAQKQRRVLAKTGAYARVAMKRSIRRAPSRKKPRTWLVRGVPCLVPFKGKVTDARTSRPVPRHIADEARAVVAKRQRARGAGKPPRSRSGELKQHIYFGVDPKTESVVIGPMVFRKQPAGLVGAKSIPELLNKGGGQRLKGVLVKYAPHPFVEPILPIAEKKMAEEIERTPL